MNPKFSSTTGIQIAMTKFNTTIYNAKQGTAWVGSGQVWEDVYGVLEPYNVSVLGGRIPGIGVGGLALGGGMLYSMYKTLVH
jgi:FAD/FMN-containing dehydrogenase